MFQHKEKPKNVGIWYDKAIPFAGLQTFGTEKNKHSSAQLFRQAYYELLIANDNKEQYDQFHKTLQLRKAVGTIPLGLIDAQIYFVDSNAIKNGVLVQRGENMPFSKEKVEQVFQQKHILLASLLNEKPLKANKSYQIELSTDFFLQHSSKNISQIVLIAEGKEYSFTPPPIIAKLSICYSPKRVHKSSNSKFIIKMLLGRQPLRK